MLYVRTSSTYSYMYSCQVSSANTVRPTLYCTVRMIPVFCFLFWLKDHWFTMPNYMKHVKKPSGFENPPSNRRWSDGYYAELSGFPTPGQAPIPPHSRVLKDLFVQPVRRTRQIHIRSDCRVTPCIISSVPIKTHPNGVPSRKTSCHKVCIIQFSCLPS